MRKLRILGLAFVAAFAFCAVAAASAFAAEWLVDSASITSNVAVMSEGTLTLENMSNGVSVECSGENEGTVGPNGTDEITKITELGQPTVTKIKCKLVNAGSVGCKEPTQAEAMNLPWATELVLLTFGGVTELRDLIGPHPGGGNPEWLTECTISIFKVVQECSAPEGTTAITENAAEGDITATFDNNTEEAKCGSNGAEIGLVLGSLLIYVLGKTLGVND